MRALWLLIHLLAAIGRFLDWVAIAVVMLWATGLGLFASTPIELVPASWWVMVAIAVVMTVVFCVLKLRRFPALVRAREAGDRKTVAALLARMHRLVVTNLALGLIAIAQIKLY